MGKIELFQHTADIDRPEGVRTTWLSVTPEYATKVLDEYEKFCDAHPDERVKGGPVGPPPSGHCL